VFNTLNWRRSGEVSIDMGKDQEIVDLTNGAVVPAELLLTGPNFIRVRFRAENVPAVGYKVYALRPAGKESSPASIIGGTTLENTYYKVQLDPETGAIRSIYDKELGRELVDQGGPYRFGQYLYVTGGDKSPNTILQYSKVYPKPDLQVCPSSDGKVISITHTAGGEVAKVEYAGKNAKAIKAEVRLFDQEKKIEIVEEIDKEAVLAKEAVYFAFPFAMEHPQFQYEVQTGVVDPAKNMYAGAGHEWFSVQHWASVQQAGISGSVMPLDAPLVTFGDINRGEWPDTFGQRPGTIFSYVMNNYWDTNYRASQGGYFKFRYVITSAPSTDVTYLSRRGWEEMTPLETDMITSQDKALAQSASQEGDTHPIEAQDLAAYYHIPRLDGKQNGFVEMDDANVLLETWKVAEDGNGTVMRFSDLGGKDRSVAVQLRGIQISRAWKTDALERGNQEVPVSGNRFQFQIHPHEIVTIRIAGDK
jgi:alpha-mannosidase